MFALGGIEEIETESHFIAVVENLQLNGSG